MLEKYSVENFKAFGKLQTIPIKPITLVFGANGSGKSSLIHSFLYLNEIMRTGELDIIHTEIGGSIVDLGGFNQFVFRRDTNQQIKFTFELKFTDNSPSPMTFNFQSHSSKISVTIGTTQIESRKSIYAQNPQILSYELIIDDVVFFRAISDSNSNLKIDVINFDHPAFEIIFQGKAKLDLIKREKFDFNKILKINNEILYNTSIKFIRNENIDYIGLQFMLRERIAIIVDEIIKEYQEIVNYNFFEKLIYHGPLRSYPPRHLAFYDNRDADWEGVGGKEWYNLLRNEKIQNKINDWLGADKLETRYRLETQNLTSRELLKSKILNKIDNINDKNYKNKSSFKKNIKNNIIKLFDDLEIESYPELVLTDFHTKTPVSHRDIGVGVSQVLPVLISAFGSEDNLIAIEQPELHIHPALQAELGDVFINSALGDQNNRFLLETHSEHLILRVLRRIRETYRNTIPKEVHPIKPVDVCVLYMQPSSKGTQIIELPVTEDGSFERNWPKGFFEERAEELFG